MLRKAKARLITTAFAMLALGGVVLAVDNYPYFCLLYTSPSPRDGLLSRMPSSA